jgi:hypothetical protein
MRWFVSVPRACCPRATLAKTGEKITAAFMDDLSPAEGCLIVPQQHKKVKRFAASKGRRVLPVLLRFIGNTSVEVKLGRALRRMRQIIRR